MSRINSSAELRQQQLHEHDELLREIEEVDTALASGGRPETAAELLEAMLLTLNSHFSYEENHGLFRQVVQQAPRLAPQAAALQDEHARLSGQLKHIRDLTHKALTHNHGLVEACDAFHAFRQELARHEHAEHALLYNAFETDIGDKD